MCTMYIWHIKISRRSVLVGLFLFFFLIVSMQWVYPTFRPSSSWWMLEVP